MGVNEDKRHIVIIGSPPVLTHHIRNLCWTRLTMIEWLSLLQVVGSLGARQHTI